MSLAHDHRIEILTPAALAVSTWTDQLESLLDNTTQLPDGRLGVHWTLANAQKLALAGFDPPSPLRHTHKWHVQPFAHQIRTAEFISVHRRCGVWSAQGTGKTLSAIAACDYLLSRGAVRRVLILCPLSVMRVAWCADMNNFAPHRRITVAHGTKDKRIAAIDAESEFVVMNFDGIKLMESHLKGKFDMIVADEANAFKNFRSDRSKVLRRLLTKDTRLVLMTGTPASQSPEDAYGLAKLLDNPQCPAYFSTWQAAVMTQITQFKWRAKPDAPQRVAEILKPSIRFRKEDCLDLPEQMYVDRATEMGVEQKKVYEQLRKEALIALGSGDKLTAANAGAMLNKLLQISSGAVKTSDGGVLEVECKDRFNDLVDIVTGTTRKFIIFANYRAPIAMLHRMLRELHIETATITGDTPMNVRSTLFNAFQIEHSPLRGLVIQPAAAAHGVTLTAADTVVWWGPPASVELYKQANDRPHRIGQKNPVTIFHLSSSPAEAKMYKLLRQNIAVHEKIVDLFGEIARD